MIALLQRVSSASVSVGGERIAAIGHGLLAFIGIVREDDERIATRLAERIAGFRMFADSQGRMNLSVRETGGAVLLVPQFTLAADTRTGMRASFAPAAPPETAVRLFDRLASVLRASPIPVECGRFGADMRVSLTNEGPVTFWVEA